VELHVGVAVKGWVPLALTVGVNGVSPTEVRVMTTVISVDPSLVIPFNVALTKIPTDPWTVPAVNVCVDPEPLRAPRVGLESAHTYVTVPGQVEVQVGVAVKGCVPVVLTVGVSGPTATEVRLMTVTVMTVDAILVFAPRVALTKIPPVTAVGPAVKVTVAPVPVIAPRVALVTDQTYVTVPGHEGVHAGVAVKGWVPVALTVGVSGLTATELSTGVVTVITVFDSTVVPLRVALTKIPPVIAVVPAVNVTEAPVPVSAPRVALVTAHAYVMVPGQVELHVGVAVKGWVALIETVGVVGLIATDVMVAVETVIIVDADFVTPLRVAFT
jgi:hypothetical protein